MRVPQSPKSLRRVMTVSSVRSEEDEGAASSSSDDGSNTTSSKNTFKKSRSNNNSNIDTSRPPRPTYTARYKDGKYTVGVEATLFAGKEDSVSENANNNNDDNDNSVKNANNECDAKKLLDGQAATSLPASFHRSRDRTRISAVQRLVERKLAQKERERLRERELERDRLAHHLSGKARSSSSNSCYVRERSWDATYHSSSSFGGRSFSASGPEKEKNTSGGRNEKQEQQLPKTRTEKENEYLASLLWRTSRSCSGTRRRVPQSDGEEEVAKTIITIGPGKPTRIREHSPSKRSPTSEHPPSNFGSLHNINSTADNEENEDKPTPLKSVPVHRDSSPSKKSESLYKNTTPLKSTGLFREFAQTTRTTTTKTSDGKRKTSFTTEKTFQVNVDAEAEKARRLSIDCNYVYEKSTPTYSTFSQSDENQAPISSSTSSLASSFSSTSSADLSTEKEPIRLSRLRPATFNSPPTEKRTEPTPEPPIRERKTSRRIFISTAFNSNNNINNNNNSKNDSCNDDTSSSVSNSSTEDNATTGSDSAGSPFSSASSRLLFNLSSGYRYHRAAAAASSTINNNNNNSNNTRHININISTSNNKSFNSNNDAASYPRRRFSQEHLAQEDKDTFGGESVFVTRPVRQPVRKISLPVRPMREAASMRREATSLADQKKEEGNELYKTSNYREALQRYSEAISLCPETPAFYGNRAACYMMLAQFARALEDARTSVQLDPQFTKGYIRVAKCCIATGDIASARQALETALSLEPNNSAVTQENNALKTLQKHQTDATNAFNAGDHRKALFCLDRALEVATASRNLKLLRAECLAYLGRYGEAQEVANDLLRQDSTNVDAIFVRGLCLYYEDNVDKAFTHFQQVLRFAPDHQRAKDIYKKAKLLRQKKEDGNAAFKSSKWTEAYDLYTEALAIDPCNKFTNAKLYFNRATVAAKLKKLKESIEDCSAALALDEKYMKALLRRAKSYMDLEMFDEAVRDYEAAQRSDRGNREYHQLLQHAKLELKKSKRKDYYKILGVERGASDEEIKRAYRKRALVHHPDRHSSSTEEEKKEHEKKFKEIGEAYGVLSDAKKRSRYDNGCDIDDLEGGGGHGGFGGDIDPDQIFKAFFSGGGGHHHGGGHHPFGGFGGGAGPSQMPGGFSFQFG